MVVAKTFLPLNHSISVVEMRIKNLVISHGAPLALASPTNSFTCWTCIQFSIQSSLDRRIINSLCVCECVCENEHYMFKQSFTCRWLWRPIGLWLTTTKKMLRIREDFFFADESSLTPEIESRLHGCRIRLMSTLGIAHALRFIIIRFSVSLMVDVRSRHVCLIH